MARLYTSSLDLGHAQAAGLTRVGAAAGLSFATDKARTGARSLKLASGTAVGNYVQRNIAGVAGRRYWIRAYCWLASGALARDITLIEAYVGTVANWAEVHVESTTGNIEILTSTGPSVDLGVLFPRDQWVCVEYGITVNAAANDTFDVYLNGVQAGATFSAAWQSAALSGVVFGNDTSGATPADLWIDDLAINDDQGASQNGRPGEGKVYTLLPTGDGTAGVAEANWTKPGGATVGKSTSVDNVPPVYAADSALVGAAESFLRNPTNAASDLTLALQTYTAVGIGAGDAVVLTQPIAGLGSSSATDTTGTLKSQANPADAGQALATFDNGVASATATTWPRGEGIVSYAPSVVLGTAPQVRVSRAAAARTVMVNVVALLVEVQPSTGSTIAAAGGIASAEAWGSSSVAPGAVSVAPTSIASAEAFGSPTVALVTNVAPSSIPTAEAWGTPALTVGAVAVAPASIGSLEAWGASSVARGAVSVAPSSIGSAEAFGSPTVTPPAAAVAPASIGSAEAWGTTTVARGAVAVAPPSIGSAEAFGSSTLTRGAVAVTTTAIPSAEAWGATIVLSGGSLVAPPSIGSGEAWGAANVTRGAVAVTLPSIGSAEAWGTPTVTPPAAAVSPTGIGSSEAWGTPALTTVYTLAPASIGSLEAWGTPLLTVAAAAVTLAGIPSAEAWGTTTVVGGGRHQPGHLEPSTPARLAGAGAARLPGAAVARFTTPTPPHPGPWPPAHVELDP